MTPSPAQPSRRPTALEGLVGFVEGASWVDSVAAGLAKAVRDRLPGGQVKDALSGTPLGHPLHPLLTDVVIGSLLSASLLDAIGGEETGDAAERLIAVALAAYGPTVASGLSDWADAEPGNDAVRRTGAVHATSNAVAVGLYAASLAARRRGSTGRGKALAALGAAALGLGGYLGAHLSFVKGIGPDQTVYDAGPGEWADALAGGDLEAGEPTRVVVGDTPVLLYRTDGEVLAVHDRCSHRGCSLAEGEVEGEEIVCGCHGSRFSLRDGSLRRGPATNPQPAYETRERDGRVEIRLA